MVIINIKQTNCIRSVNGNGAEHAQWWQKQMEFKGQPLNFTSGNHTCFAAREGWIRWLLVITPRAVLFFAGNFVSSILFLLAKFSFALSVKMAIRPAPKLKAVDMISTVGSCSLNTANNSQSDGVRCCISNIVDSVVRSPWETVQMMAECIANCTLPENDDKPTVMRWMRVQWQER